MKKMNFFMLVAVLFAAIGFTSCDSTPNYQQVIPAEPVAVFKANIKSMLDKSELLKDNQVLGKLKTDINEAPEGSRDILRAMLDDPEKCGLNLEHPAFVVIENIEQAKGFVLFSVKDYDQLSAFVNSMNNISYTLSDKDGYKLASVENEKLMAFDEEKLIIAFAQGAFDVTEYMTEKEGNAEKSSDLKEFIAGNNDFSIYVDYKDILRLTNGMAKNATELLETELYEGTKLIANINFEEGRILADTKLYGNEKLKEIYNKSTSSAETSLQKYIPSSCIAFMQAGIKNLGTTIIDNIPEAKKNEINDGINDINNSLASKGVNNKFSFELLNSLDGGIAAGIAKSATTGEFAIPQIAMYAECKDKKLFTLLVEIMKANNMQLGAEAEDVYSIPFGENEKYYIGYADDTMFIVSGNIYAQMYKDKSLKALEQNISNHSLTSYLKNQNGMFIDCKTFVDMINESGLARGRNDQEILSTIENFSSIGYVQKDAMEWELFMNFSDEKTNALKQIKDIAIDYAISEYSRY